MMTCREAEPMISKQLDGELPPGLAKRLGEHLERCRVCRELAQAMAGENRRLRRALAVDAADLQEIERVLLARAGPSLSSSQPVSRHSGLRAPLGWRPALGAVAAIFVVVAGVRMLTSIPPGSPGTEEISQPPERNGGPPEAIFVVKKDSHEPGLLAGDDGPSLPVEVLRRRILVTDLISLKTPGAAPGVFLELETQFISFPEGGWR